MNANAQTICKFVKVDFERTSSVNDTVTANRSILSVIPETPNAVDDAVMNSE